MKWSKYRKSTGQMRDKIRNANVFWFTLLRFHSHHIYAICIISFIYRCQTLFVEAHKYMAGTLCVYSHTRTHTCTIASIKSHTHHAAYSLRMDKHIVLCWVPFHFGSHAICYNMIYFRLWWTWIWLIKILDKISLRAFHFGNVICLSLLFVDPSNCLWCQFRKFM